MRDSRPVARVGLRARATSSHPALPVAKPPPVPRGVRFGPYYIHESLGEGGMASVHRATRIDGVGGSVALKRLWPHLSEDRAFVESFVQEARLARLLRHDNIAQAYELGKANGLYYIAMELVSGPTLESVMRQSRTAAGAIPLPIIVEILIQLCDALAHAHGLRDELGRPLSLIHRDVSPANVILSNTGTVKLIDFGIAKAARSRQQTEAGVIKGKLAYVAPEYTLGHLDARADLFAIGVVAHELLTGHRLFAADNEIATIFKVRRAPISPPSRHEPRVTRDLDDIVMTALQRDPDQRWQNAAAMGTALRGVAAEIGRVDAREIRRWVEWAFTREPWSESGVGRLVDTLAVTGVKARGTEATLAVTGVKARGTQGAPTLPAVPAAVRKPAPKPALDDDAPTLDDAPPTIPVPRRDLTQLVAHGRPWAVLVLVLLVLALVAAAAWTGRLADVIATI